MKALRDYFGSPEQHHHLHGFLALLLLAAFVLGLLVCRSVH